MGAAGQRDARQRSALVMRNSYTRAAAFFLGGRFAPDERRQHARSTAATVKCSAVSGGSRNVMAPRSVKSAVPVNAVTCPIAGA